MLSLVRIIEFIIIQHYGIHDVTYNTLLNNSINLDAYFAILISLIFIIPCFLISLKSTKLSNTIYFIVWIIAILISSCLTHFYISAEYLLTSVLFQFSFDEIWHLIEIESGTHRNLIWLLYLTIPIYIASYLFLLNNNIF